jgi:sec-independent protein translocase protein TatA
MPFNIGAPELIIILIIALVVLGPGKLPDVAQSLGKSLREFRKAASDVADAGKLDAPAPAPTPAPSPAQPAAIQPAASSDSSDSDPSEPSGNSSQS